MEKQLKHLESLGIIEPVQFSDWAAQIVPVLKANGELRVLGDYKRMVNRVAKLETLQKSPVTLKLIKTWSNWDLTLSKVQDRVN